MKTTPVEHLQNLEDELHLSDTKMTQVLLPVGILTVVHDFGWVNSRGLSVCYYYQDGPDLPKVQIPEHVAAGLIGEKWTTPWDTEI